MEFQGKVIPKDQRFIINIAYLQMNPDQWITPDDYIPERFDPSSKYYLTPSGKKRHPMSYGPFLGGKRVCLGKTFAENIGRCVLAIILSQIECKFADPSVREEKPPNTFLDSEPPIFMYLSLAVTK
jgi:cytochrome P450